MKILHASEWKFLERDESNWTDLIDLRKCDTETELIRACAAVLHGRDSSMGGMKNIPNLNWLNDVVGDWFWENYGKKRRIYVVGANNLFKIGPKFAINYLDVLNNGRINAIFGRCQDLQYQGNFVGYKTIVDEVHSKSIWVFLN